MQFYYYLKYTARNISIKQEDTNNLSTKETLTGVNKTINKPTKLKKC